MQNFVVKNDQNSTKLMNHLGGIGWTVYVEWFPGVYRGITLVNGHPGKNGPNFLQVKLLPVQPRVIWALS